MDIKTQILKQAEKMFEDQAYFNKRLKEFTPDERHYNCIVFPIAVKESWNEKEKAWVYSNEEYNISVYGSTKREAQDEFRDCVRDILLSPAPVVEDRPKWADLLDDLEDYFDNKADADVDDEKFIPNKEMKLLAEIRKVRAGQNT